MKILFNLVRFLVNISFSIFLLIIFLYKFGDIGIIDYFIFFIPFLSAGVLYRIDKRFTDNNKKSVYYISILFYFLSMIFYYVYALYHITISF